MILMRKLFLSVSFAAICVSAAYSDLKVNDNLSLTGFIDMSYTSVDEETKETNDTAKIDQIEIDFLFSFGEKFSAQVDLEAQDSGANQSEGDLDLDIEQAFINYQITSGLSVKAGRFLSYSGWETEEPTGLFQYSGTGYAGTFYGYYQDGASLMYSTEVFDLGVSLVDDVYGSPAGGSGNVNDLGVELMAAVRPVEGLTLKAFYSTDKGNGGTFETEDKINVWASYGIGGLTLAAEYNTADNLGGTKDAEADGYLLMANYAWSQFGVTLRYHAWEQENAAGATVRDTTGITIAPSYAATDYLTFVLEYKTEDEEATTAFNDKDSLAFEALVVF